MASTNENLMENFSQPIHNQGSRQALFDKLDHILKISLEKFDRQRASNRDRLSWGRLIVSTVDCYGNLLKDVELETLELRVQKLEEAKK